MQFPTLNRDRKEYGFGVYKNVKGSATVVGEPAVFDVTAADGNRVSLPATATLSSLVGVWLDATADTEFGRCIVTGMGNARVTNTTNQAIAGGDILVAVNGATHLTWSAAADGKSGFVTAGEAYATATAGAVTAALKKVFLKTL